MFILQPNPHDPLTTGISLLNRAETLTNPSDLYIFTGLPERFSSHRTLWSLEVLCSSTRADVSSSLFYSSAMFWALQGQIILSTLMSKRSPGIPGSPTKGKGWSADVNSHLPNSATRMPLCTSAKEKHYLLLPSNITLSKGAPSYRTLFCGVHRLWRFSSGSNRDSTQINRVKTPNLHVSQEWARMTRHRVTDMPASL